MLLEPLYSSIVNNCVCTDGKKELQSKKNIYVRKKRVCGPKKTNEKNGKNEKKREEKYTEYKKSHLAKLYRTLMKDVDGLCAI